MPSDRFASLARPVRLVAVGDELLRGEVLDRNGHRLAGRLAALGWMPDSMAQSPDHGGATAATVRRWLEEGGVLVLCGGLGPTADDLTREDVAAGLGVALVEHPAAAAMIRAREERLGRRFTPFTHRQALLPEGCEPVENPVGTAPGFGRPHPSGAGWLLVLPGVPFEFAAMVDAVLPPPAAPQAEDWLLLGVGEDRLAALLEDYPGRDHLGFYPSMEGHRMRVPLRDAVDRDDLARRLAPHLASREEGRPEAVLVKLLAARGETLAVAESCTGGMLGARITRVAGASDVFVGGVISYADAVKTALLDVDAALLARDGAVSEPVARAMADGVRARLASDWALAITGIAGPGGERPGKPVGTIHVALAGPATSAHRLLRAGWEREDNRRYAVLQAMTLLWEQLRHMEP